MKHHARSLAAVAVPLAFTTVLGVVAGVSLARAAERGAKGEGAEEHDTPVRPNALPAAVVQTASRYDDGLALERAVLADEDGLRVYELHYAGNGRRLEVQTTQDGSLFAVEERVAEAAVPALVKERAAKLFAPKAKLHYERTVSVLYEVAARGADGKETEVLVNQAGAAFREVAGGVRESGH